MTLCTSDIERPRTLLELREFSESFFENTEAYDLRMNHGAFTKLIREEVYPALLFLEAKYRDRPGIKYAPKVGNQSFDGTVIDEFGKVIEFVECTCAVDGQLEKLRMKALNEKGHVCLHSVPEGYVRGKKCKKTEFETTTVATAWIVDRIVAEIGEAINRKAAKHYSGQPVLVVSFEGFPASKYDGQFIEIRCRVASELPELSSQFRGIWIVDTHGQLGFELPSALGIEN